MYRRRGHSTFLTTNGALRTRPLDLLSTPPAKASMYLSEHPLKRGALIRDERPGFNKGVSPKTVTERIAKAMHGAGVEEKPR